MAENILKKIFNDSVHGHIEMHPLLVKIIDTPEFQRLRNIKQLGGGYYVYPGASHNRFEHSIGVAHLAGKLVQNLRTRQKNLGINDKDELCVQIAGLCHDLGHGPFSHTFQNFMERRLQEQKLEEANIPKKPPCQKQKWEHEEMSKKMFDHLITTHCIKNLMESEYKFTEKDFTFIKDLIKKDDKKGQEQEQEESKKRAFLYEIVANPTTGIDVDKMDYFSRDCHHLGMKCNFSHERYMMFARVCKDKDEKTNICMRDKEARNMYELFHLRNLLHHSAYQHRVTKPVELMIEDALFEADGHFKLGDKNLTISAAAYDPETYIHLTDDILQQILRSKEPNLSKAREIIRRIENRDFYKFISEETFKGSRTMNNAEIKTKLDAWLGKIQGKDGGPSALTSDDFRVVCIPMNYGMKDKNPVDQLCFYSKDDPDTMKKISGKEVSYLLPKIFAETKVMLFYEGLAKEHAGELWADLKKPKEHQTSSSPETGADGAETFEDVSGKEYPTSSEIIKHFSEERNHKFFDEKTLKSEEVKHLDNDDKWKAKLKVWTEKVKKECNAKENFKLVVYKRLDFTKVMLFYKGLSQDDVKKFWDEVRKDLGQ